MFLHVKTFQRVLNIYIHIYELTNEFFPYAINLAAIIKSMVVFARGKSAGGVGGAAGVGRGACVGGVAG